MRGRQKKKKSEHRKHIIEIHTGSLFLTSHLEYNALLLQRGESLTSQQNDTSLANPSVSNCLAFRD